MDECDLTMEEYIELLAEKAQRRKETISFPNFEDEDYIAEYEEDSFVYKMIRSVAEAKVLDFEGMPELMRDVLHARMLMEHRDDEGVVPLLARHGVGCWIGQRPLLVGPYIRRFFMGRKSGALISSRQFVAWLAEQFGLLSEERLQGLTIILPALPIMDMTELVRLQICVKLDDTWAWVPTGPARHEGDVSGVAKEAPVAPGGGAKDEEVPQVVPPTPRNHGERIARLEVELHGVREALEGQREVLDIMAQDFSQFTTWTVTSLSLMMDMSGVTYTPYSDSPLEYQRRRTDGASTSAAPQQLDP
ncbi:hypothetical protein Tco_0242921 [Tanacetum coccineum]